MLKTKTKEIKTASRPEAVKTEKNKLSVFLLNIPSFITNLQFNRKTIFIILIICLSLLFYYKKNLFIAAMVNGQPITNFELLDKLNQQYRQQTLTQMVDEKIILTEAQKNGVTVSKKDIDNKITELENNLGGSEILDSLLTQQGMTKESLRTRLMIQLTIEKLYSKDATISAEEVDKFIVENKESLRATESAQQKKEAEETLKQQKLTNAFNEKFGALRQTAKIQIF